MASTTTTITTVTTTTPTTGSLAPGVAISPKNLMTNHYANNTVAVSTSLTMTKGVESSISTSTSATMSQNNYYNPPPAPTVNKHTTFGPTTTLPRNMVSTAYYHHHPHSQSGYGNYERIRPTTATLPRNLAASHYRSGPYPVSQMNDTSYHNIQNGSTIGIRSQPTLATGVTIIPQNLVPPKYQKYDPQLYTTGNVQHPPIAKEQNDDYYQQTEL